MGVKLIVATAHMHTAYTNRQWQGNYCLDTKDKIAAKTALFTHRQYEMTQFRAETAERL